MGKITYLLILMHFIYSKIPHYTLMKRNETLTFKLNTSNSAFYVYLPYEEDYEIDEKLTPKIYHFIKMDKKLGFNQIFIDTNGSFPDESEFNKSSIEDIMDEGSLEVDENVRVNLYYRLEKPKDENNTILFVFYIKDEFIDSFDPNETFSIHRVKFNNYVDETIISSQLESDHISIYGFKIDYYNSSKFLLYTNSPISSIYEYKIPSFKKNMTNINLYYYDLDRDIKEFDIIVLIVYNPYKYKQNIFIEYKYQTKNLLYNSIYLNGIDNYELYHNSFSLIYITIDQPGLFKILSPGEHFKYLFCDDISEIKNLTDLKDIKHFKYTMERFLYIPNKFFIILIRSSVFDPGFKIEKIEIKEIEKEINVFNFEYFRISKGNTLNFNLNTTNQSVVLKLLSNNGRVNINNNDYYFKEREVKVINISDEHIKINAIDKNFTFAIKLKIPDELIEYPEFGKRYILPKNTYYKFLIYKINVQNYSFIEVRNNYSTFHVNCELTAEKNINEIEKGEKHELYYPYLYIKNYKDLFPNSNLYLFLYFENLTNNDISIETKYYKPIKFEEDKFNLIKIDDYMDFLDENKREVYFIIPCIGNIQAIRRGMGLLDGEKNYKPFKVPFRPYPHDFLEISSGDQSKPIGFINHYTLDLEDKDYGYIEEKNTKPLTPEYLFDKLNDTHIRFFIEEIFSDATEINYTFVITSIDNYNLLEPRCEFFYNFYLNSPPELNNLEIIHFSNDFKNNSNDSNLIYYIDLPNPTKVNLYKRNQRLAFKIMGITGPKRKYVKFYDTFFLRICYETCLKCNDTGSDDFHNCTSCVEGKLLHEDNGNCLDKCSTGYYQKENVCKKCHENCESCSKESEIGNNNCLTCNKESKYKYLVKVPELGNNCVEECPEGTALDNENYLCKKCHENCKSCAKESEKDNNNCLTCNKESKYKYLVNAPDLGKNCVDECPEGTKLDNEKYECIKKENKNYIYITVGVIGGVIIIIVVVLLIIKYKKKNEKGGEEVIMKEMNIKSALTDE